MKNTIVERVFDFLKKFPPFNILTEEQLYLIAKNVKVIYLENEELIFKQNDPIHDGFYIVKDGLIGLFHEESNTLADKCDEGDVFGLRAIIKKDNYILCAKAIEESIIYSISSHLLEEIINVNVDVNKFLIASFATNTRNPYSKENKGKLFANENYLKKNSTNFTEIQPAPYSKKPVSCDMNISIKEAALIMTEMKVGSIIILENKKPIGIITDKDLRTKVSTGYNSISENVQKIMSSPLITSNKKTTIAEAQIAMLKHQITHLGITKDGTTDSKLIGILSEHDILVMHGNNPYVLIKEAQRAKKIETLKYVRLKAEKLLKGYLSQNVSIQFILKIISSINDTITNKIINFSKDEMKTLPPTNFGWLAIGSQGRKEQLLLTDQDNALVFENVSEANYLSTKDYFLELSKKINEKLDFVGFEFCPAKMMASNPKWCLSLNEWRKQFDNWITHPDEDKIMLCTIFFDYSLVNGDEELVNKMADSIFKSIHSYEIFLNYLGLNALKNPPPLSFFKQFLLEHNGEHKDQFDIKSRAIMPLVDAARLLILSKKTKSINNTILRFEKLIKLEPQNKDLYKSCINSFKILLRFRTQEGLKNNNSGRFIDLKLLDKSDKLKLKSCFKPIKDIQELIRVRFNLAQMM